MCDASMVALGARGFGTIMQANAALQRGQYTKTIDGMNAENANAAAGQALQRGAFEDLRATMHGDAVLAEQRVMGSGSGADVNVGGGQQTQRASEAVLDVTRRAIQVDAALTAYSLKTRAQGFYQEGAYAEAQAKNEFIGTFLGGIGGAATDINLPHGGGSQPFADNGGSVAGEGYDS